MSFNFLGYFWGYVKMFISNDQDFYSILFANVNPLIAIKYYLYRSNLTPFNNTHYKTIECDINLIKKTLIDTINHVKEYSFMTNDIQIQVDSTELWYRLGSIKDYTKKIPAIG